MTAARKNSFNQRSMSVQSRNSAYAAINILWLQMRHDLRFESKDVIRDERMTWIAGFLGLKKLDSTKDLSDRQIGFVLEEMRRLTGQASKQQKAPQNSEISNNPINSAKPADVIHLASEEQVFTINKLVGAIGWSEEGFRDFLFRKFRRRSPQMLTFKNATALTMILLNIAADKELRAQGKTKISRKMTAVYIPVLKRKLGIDR